MKIGDLVRVKKTGQEGNIRILEGVPSYKAYVDMIPGADAGYVYFTMYVAAEEQYIEGEPSGVSILALNPYDIDELEIVKEKIWLYQNQKLVY